MISTKKDRDLIATSLTHHLWTMRQIEDTGVIAILDKPQSSSADYGEMANLATNRLRESLLALSRMIYDDTDTETLCAEFEVTATVIATEEVFGHVLEYVDDLLAKRTAIDELGALYEPEE